MRTLFALAVALAACTPADKPATAAAAATPVAAVAPAPHDEAAILELTQQLFRAHDAGDANGLAAMLAPDFMRVTTMRFYDTEITLASVRMRQERAFPRYSDRAFELTRTRFFGDTAIFTARCSVKLVRAEGAAPLLIERTETLVWTRTAGAWKLANWQEEYAGPEMERIGWNETFRMSTNFDLKPNRLLVETVRGRKPGVALDVGIGQGRNALFLATQGWDVTGVDISDEGIRQAEEAAKAAGVTLHSVVADIDTWDWGQGKYDVIGYIYMGDHPPVDKIRRALKPGGIVVIEFFMIDATKGTGMGGFEKGELPGMFKEGFKVLRHEEVEDVADWGMRRVPLVRFVAEKL